MNPSGFYVDPFFFHRLFDVAEINHHSVGIQFFGTAIDCDYPIVTMQILTFTLIRKIQTVCSRNLHSFNDCVHTVNTLVKISFYRTVHLMSPRCGSKSTKNLEFTHEIDAYSYIQ